MLPTLFAWILAGLVLAAAYPWAAWLLAQGPRRDAWDGGFWLPALLALALSMCALTLLMFWQALLGIRFDAWTVTLPYLALLLPGWLLWRRLPGDLRPAMPAMPAGRIARLALFALIAVGAAVLFNAAYWPFYRDDTLGIYARYARLMAETGTLVPFAGRDDAFYQAYPVGIPLAYTYTYLISGWINEYLARVIPALFSLGCLPAVYILGRLIYSPAAGWLAALLLALTPAFARWASSGYVDLPMAFAYTLSAVFAWRLWQSRRWTDALLAGLMLGLAAWTKNAALFGVPLLAGWLAFGWLKRRISFGQIALALAMCAVVAAPWYIRNWLEAGLIVPPTAWVDQARPTLTNRFILITLADNFSLSGWLITGGVFSAIWQAGVHRSVGAAFLLWWTLPFFLVWWLLVSYDPRFVLLFLPLLAVAGGGWLAGLWAQVPSLWRRRLLLPLAALLLALAACNTWIGVEYKREILRDPLMSDAQKHNIVRPGG